MTKGNQAISRSGVLGPALFVRTGTPLEDFELYGSLQKQGSFITVYPPDCDRHLLFVVNTNKGCTRTGKAGHWTLAENYPLQHRKNCSNGRVEEVKRVARLAAEADGTRRNVLCTVVKNTEENIRTREITHIIVILPNL